MSLLCVVTFSVLHTTQALPSPSRQIIREEVQQNEEMKMVDVLLYLLQAKEMAKLEAAKVINFS